MSNHLAVAVVTASLSQHLVEAISVVPGAEVKFGRPDKTAPNIGINVYLYQVSHNGAHRFSDLPTRRSDGTLLDRPKVALDLHYLLTFHGVETDLEPQRLLGAAVRLMNSKPNLPRSLIRATVANPSFASILGGSTLAEDIELVKFTPAPLSLEEMSKLWSTLLKADHTLSLAYQGSVVVIESEALPSQHLPVRVRNFAIVPFQHPHLDSAEPVILPFVAGAQVAVKGTSLLGGTTRMRIGSTEVIPAVGSTASRLLFDLTANFRAGVQPIQVIQRIVVPGAAMPNERGGFESNLLPFLIQPTLAGMAYDATDPVHPKLVATVNPVVDSTQRCSLLLNQNPPGLTPVSYQVDAEARLTASATLRFPAEGVAPGNYVCRVRVDGADSLLTGLPAEGVTVP